MTVVEIASALYSFYIRIAFDHTVLRKRGSEIMLVTLCHCLEHDLENVGEQEIVNVLNFPSPQKVK